ncbi:MAG: HNH endonuclease signature motif containing protein, partial [Kineosporiaceae bacterium]
LDAQGRPIAPGLATDLGTGEPLDPGTFARFLCDAVLDPTLVDDNGAILAQGRTTRLATAAQRRALITRDRGCVVPGCTAPVTWCDAHHVIWWRHGGSTDVDNLVLLCARHHTAVHAGSWQIQMIEGVPWVIPPRTLDPTRTPRRSTLWRNEHNARQLGHHLRNRQLRLDLQLPGVRLDVAPRGPSPGGSPGSGPPRVG